EVELSRTWAVTRGSRPINLSADGDRLLFGEYGGAEMDSLQVRIYVSEDGGKHLETALELPVGEVHHLHNILVDPLENVYWVLAGDHGPKAGIGVLSKDLRHFEWVARGSQMVRAVGALIRPDCLIYGSDTEMEANFVVRLDKKSGAFERLQPIEGGSHFAADFGSLALISTCVEPSRINRATTCSLYGSVNGLDWRR